MRNILFVLFLSLAAVCKGQDCSSLPEYCALKKYCARVAPDEKPRIPADTNLIGIWKMKEDIDSHNYFVVERFDHFLHVFTYMNREGSNRTYENVGAVFFTVNDTRFLAVSDYDREENKPGWFFLKASGAEKDMWNMTLSLVADTTLKDLKSTPALRERLAKNINNPSYYKAPVHLHKILPLMYCK